MDRERIRQRAQEVLAQGQEKKRQNRLQAVRAGKVRARTLDEIHVWGRDVYTPAPTLRRITKHSTRPRKASAWPWEGERVWWIEGVTYSADPEVIAACARAGYLVEDAPAGVPAEHAARVEEAERRRVKRDARRGRKGAKSSPE